MWIGAKAEEPMDRTSPWKWLRSPTVMHGAVYRQPSILYLAPLLELAVFRERSRVLRGKEQWIQTLNPREQKQQS